MAVSVGKNILGQETEKTLSVAIIMHFNRMRIRGLFLCVIASVFRLPVTMVYVNEKNAAWEHLRQMHVPAVLVV